MLALLAMRPVDTQELVEIAVPLFVVVPDVVCAARWLWQSFSHLAVLDAVDRMVAAWMAIRAFVEGDTYVVAEVVGDDARLTVGDYAAPDARRDLVILLNVFAGCADHSFLHACAALRTRRGMVAI